MKFRPMLDHVLVRRAEAETKTSSGLFIPDASVGKSNKGTVLAIGPGKSTKDGAVIPIAEIKLNDVVMFSEGAGIPVKVDGEDFIVLKEEEIFAIVE